ncbi:MAG: hypothetical protein KDA93_16975 [Planctomycetaceae bacterium]|nr:hypothetical protein [Planctomycetaceae bacterium]
MSNATVDEILTLIDRLPESDRQRLDEALDLRRESEWQKAAVQMRREAAERGIDEAAIDTAIHEHRYGS